MRIFLTAATLAACLLATPALAKDIHCSLRYDMAGGGAFYKHSTGTGTITCDNGQSMKVSIESKGGGLTFGSSKIVDGIGKYSPVLDIKDLIGGYATAEANAGGGEASKAQVVTKGSISLALTGRGTGRTLGVSFGSFIIKEAGK